jgi:hypothetical protein
MAEKGQFEKNLRSVMKLSVHYKLEDVEITPFVKAKIAEEYTQREAKVKCMLAHEEGGKALFRLMFLPTRFQ